MRKSLVLFMLIVAFALPAAIAGAEYYVGAADTVYIGTDNYMFIPGENDAVLTEKVREIVTIVDETVYYTIDDDASEDYTNAALLYAYDLDRSSDPHEIAQVAFDAVYSPTDGLIYYTSKSGGGMLMAFDPSNDSYISCAQSEEAIVSVRLSMEGLLIKTESGEKLYAPRLHSFVEPEDDLQAAEIIPFNGGELTIDAKDDIRIAIEGVKEKKLIDSSAVSAIELNNTIYYVKQVEGSSSLMSYDISSGKVETLDEYDETTVNGVAAARGNIYFIGKSGIIYEYSIQDRQTRPFAYIDTAVVRQPYLAAASNLLLVYDYSADKDDSFVRKINLDTYTPNEDDLAMGPSDGGFEGTQYAALSKGSRGDDVVKLQTSLKTLGYLAGSADGIFGNATLDAVMLLQEDMGLKQTGIADTDLLKKIYDGEATKYEPYAGLKQGDSGSRVTQLQDRLRALYYMIAPAGGNFDEYTRDAVIRYQSRMGHSASGSISDTQLEELYSKKAKKSDVYLSLQSGDNAPAVKRLATRLSKLGYLSQSPTNSYNKYVVRAMKLFESNNNLRETGKASVKRQEILYSSKAKPYYPEPTPEPAKKYITEKQLKKMRNWMNKHLGENYSKAQAIEALQIKLMDLGFMGGSTSRKYDEATYNCVKEAQRAFGLKVTGVANVDTLVAMFMSVG